MPGQRWLQERLDGGRPAIRCNRDITDAVRQGRVGATTETTMPPFPLLSDADITTIQGVLEEMCPTETATGAELFAANCGSCHGADALGDTGPPIRCGKSVGFAVRNGIIGAYAGYMPPLMRLQGAEIAKIQDHLLGLCPGSATGAELFGANCAACHGTTGAGDHGRPDVRCTVPSRLHHAVYYGRGFPVEVMPTFTPALTPTEEARIAGFLQPTCSNPGADLFASNCATCHGPTGQGGRNANGTTGPGIRCSDSDEVYDAVTDGTGGMPAIADLSNARIDAIVAYLNVGCR
jgi:mono/diheme cytochrome c family protein